MSNSIRNRLIIIFLLLAVLFVLPSCKKEKIEYKYAEIEKQELELIKAVELRQKQIDKKVVKIKRYYENECTYEGHFRDYLKYIKEGEIATYYADKHAYCAYKEWYDAYQAYLEEQARIAYEEEQARIRYEQEQARLRAAAARAASGSVADYQNYAYSLFSSYGWSSYDFDCLVALWNRESKWNPLAHNSRSGAHGIPQALPASKMASHGSDYWDNPYTQIRWGLDYIRGRYGSPANAWAHSQSHGWY